MPYSLTPPEVADFLPDAPPVTEAHIALAAERIAIDFERTVDQFVGIAEDTVKQAWAIVAVRVQRKLASEALDDDAVVSETDGDYTYNKSVALVRSGWRVTDGVVRELLDVPMAHWVHI